ncbi:hypothetical protein LQZ18_02425 [Lachnospiraceae bacterium ZAX-1]
MSHWIKAYRAIICTCAICGVLSACEKQPNSGDSTSSLNGKVSEATVKDITDQSVGTQEKGADKDSYGSFKPYADLIEKQIGLAFRDTNEEEYLPVVHELAKFYDFYARDSQYGIHYILAKRKTGLPKLSDVEVETYGHEDDLDPDAGFRNRLTYDDNGKRAVLFDSELEIQTYPQSDGNFLAIFYYDENLLSIRANDSRSDFGGMFMGGVQEYNIWSEKGFQNISQLTEKGVRVFRPLSYPYLVHYSGSLSPYFPDLYYPVKENEIADSGKKNDNVMLEYQGIDLVKAVNSEGDEKSVEISEVGIPQHLLERLKEVGFVKETLLPDQEGLVEVTVSAPLPSTSEISNDISETVQNESNLRKVKEIFANAEPCLDLETGGVYAKMSFRYPSGSEIQLFIVQASGETWDADSGVEEDVAFLTESGASFKISKEHRKELCDLFSDTTREIVKPL